MRLWGEQHGAQSTRRTLNREREPHTSLGAFISKETLVKEKKKGGSEPVLAEIPETTDAFARLPPLFALSVSLWPSPCSLGFDAASCLQGGHR